MSDLLPPVTIECLEGKRAGERFTFLPTSVTFIRDGYTFRHISTGDGLWKLSEFLQGCEYLRLHTAECTGTRPYILRECIGCLNRFGQAETEFSVVEPSWALWDTGVVNPGRASRTKT